MKKLTYLSPLIMLCLLLSSCLGYKLDQIDKSSIEAMKWEKIRIEYFTLDGSGWRGYNGLTIAEKKVVQNLQSKLAIKNVKESNFIREELFIITISNGELWYGNLISENKLSIWKKGNPSPYILELENNDFYNFLRELCLHDLQKRHPEATIKSIILTDKYDDSNYEVLPKSDEDK